LSIKAFIGKGKVGAGGESSMLVYAIWESNKLRDF